MKFLSFAALSLSCLFSPLALCAEPLQYRINVGGSALGLPSADLTLPLSGMFQGIQAGPWLGYAFGSADSTSSRSLALGARIDLLKWDYRGFTPSGVVAYAPFHISQDELGKSYGATQASLLLGVLVGKAWPLTDRFKFQLGAGLLFCTLPKTVSLKTDEGDRLTANVPAFAGFRGIVEGSILF